MIKVKKRGDVAAALARVIVWLCRWRRHGKKSIDASASEGDFEATVKGGSAVL